MESSANRCFGSEGAQLFVTPAVILRTYVCTALHHCNSHSCIFGSRSAYERRSVLVLRDIMARPLAKAEVGLWGLWFSLLLQLHSWSRVILRLVHASGVHKICCTQNVTDTMMWLA